MAIERHYGKIINGKMQFTERNSKRFDNALSRLEGQDFELEIRKVQSHATNSQYAYFRKAIVGTCLESELFGGWIESEIISHFTGLFLRVTVVRKLGTKEVGISSIKLIENLPVTEMSKFIDDVLNWLAMNGISVGSPEEYFNR